LNLYKGLERVGRVRSKNKKLKIHRVKKVMEPVKKTTKALVHLDWKTKATLHKKLSSINHNFSS